jgi:hypothetical protein
MLMMLMLQSAQGVARARYFAGVRLLWLLVFVLLILGIILLIKKLMR